MTYEKFLNITLNLQKHMDQSRQLYKYGIDLIEITDPLLMIIDKLIEEVYGENGAEWFGWFCWESDFGRNVPKREDDTTGVRAWDENGNPICFSHESTWKYLEENHKK